MKWQDLIKGVAPVLGTALGGPAGGVAASAISRAIFGGEDKPVDQVADAIKSAAASGTLSPDIVQKIQAAENDFQIQLKNIALETERLGLQRDQTYIADTQNARAVHGQNDRVFWLGIAVLCTFALVTISVLLGSVAILQGGIGIKDPGAIGMVSTMIGAVVGYVAAHAQQVVAYFFGSSQGSKDKSDQLSAALSKNPAAK